jgi:hypothetical protein
MYDDLKRPWAEYAAELKQWQIDAAKDKRLPLVVSEVIERRPYEWWITKDYERWMQRPGKP